MAAQLGDTWSEQERLLSVAVEKDRKRMEDLNSILTAVSRIRRIFIHFP